MDVMEHVDLWIYMWIYGFVKYMNRPTDKERHGEIRARGRVWPLLLLNTAPDYLKTKLRLKTRQDLEKRNDSRELKLISSQSRMKTDQFGLEEWSKKLVILLNAVSIINRIRIVEQARAN